MERGECQKEITNLPNNRTGQDVLNSVFNVPKIQHCAVNCMLFSSAMARYVMAYQVVGCYNTVICYEMHGRL